MIKLSYRTDKMLFELEGETPKELFQDLAEVQSVFEADKACGKCNNTNLQFRVRTTQDGTFYEMLCMACTAALTFGQRRDGGLYPKRKDSEGMTLANRGWKTWGKAAEADGEFVAEARGPR